MLWWLRKIFRTGRICTGSWRMNEIWKRGKDKLGYSRHNTTFKQKHWVRTSMYMCVKCVGIPIDRQIDRK